MHTHDACVIYADQCMFLCSHRGLWVVICMRATTSSRRGSPIGLFARRTLATMVRVHDDDAR